MDKAALLYRAKKVYQDGSIKEMVIRRLPQTSSERPNGLKYRLYYVTEQLTANVNTGMTTKQVRGIIAILPAGTYLYPYLEQRVASQLQKCLHGR